jgi:signal transduction histidine kinase
LGLYIAQSICRLHKIEIDAHSEGKGMGTTIRLSMPLKMLWINDLPQE